MACKGSGYDTGCGSNPDFNSIMILDDQGKVTTSAHPGDIVHIVAIVKGDDESCSNYYLMFYGRKAEYLECYQDHLNRGVERAVSHPYAVPNYPGETITLGALEVLTGVLLTKTLEILLIVEGEASFIWVTAPSEFTPNVPFNIDVTVKNIGGTDDIFSRIRNQDTTEILSELSIGIPGGGQHVFRHTITLSQTTIFHCLIEIGHEESISTHRTINVVTPISLINQGGY